MNQNSTIDFPELHADHCVNRPLLNEALDLLEAARKPRSHPVPSTDDLNTLPTKLAEDGIGEVEALRLLAPTVLGQSAQLHHPGYFAHMDPPTPTIAWATALWQAAANQNTLHPDVAPTARLLQSRVIDWLAPFFGMQGGHFTAGGTLANFTAMWAARESGKVKRVICSDRAHLSIAKSAHILGLEYQVVNSDNDHRLPAQVAEDASDAMVVLTAGTVATGAIDPLARGNTAWLHVDAAWAGPLRFHDGYGSLLDGIEHADSVGFSAHKWLFQPKGTAVVLFKDADSAHEKMSYGGGYLAAPNVGLLGSAPASALPLAASLIAWGKSGLSTRIELAMKTADTLVTLIDADNRFERWGPNTSGVVVWRPVGRDARAVRNELTDAWVSLVDIDGDCWLRCVAANLSVDPQWVFDRVQAAL